MTYHPDQQESSLSYNWYRKIAEMMNKSTVAYDEFSKDAATHWLGLIGLKPTQFTRRLQEPRETREDIDKLLGK